MKRNSQLAAGIAPILFAVVIHADELPLPAPTPPDTSSREVIATPVNSAPHIEVESTTVPEHLSSLELQPAEQVIESVTSPQPNDNTIVETTPASPRLTTYQLFQTPKTEYRVYESTTTIIPATASDFGWFSLESTPFTKMKTIDCDNEFGFVSAMGIHFLRGPTSTPVESRLFDFAGGLQWRKQVNATFSFDVASSIGVYSDFEDSARDGIRLPSHAIGFLDMGMADLVFGVEYLDRDDIKLLPVGGIVFRNEFVRAELVFPRPRIDFSIDEDQSLFFKAQLGGGSWDIERPDESNDVLTYRSYEITLGVQTIDEDNDVAAFEIGYVFDRNIEFRNSPLEQQLDDSFIIRFVGYH